MNRAKLKSYAPKARKDFLRAVSDRARKVGLTLGHFETVEVRGDVAIIGGQAFPKRVADQRRRLDEQIKRKGFTAVMEEAAYTWFNRFMAIRYMELHGYLEHGYRVLSDPSGKDRPQILEQAENVTLPGVDKGAVIDLKLDGTKDEELYKLLLLGQCHALHLAMPFLFERIDDQTELLLPDNLLASDSVIRRMVTEIAEADWEQVEIIGWLYQFYISEKKDEVMGKVVQSEDIPAATQLFTPNWIVKYMVQNTLGRKWLATYPHSPIAAHMGYYIQTPTQRGSLDSTSVCLTAPRELDPEAITFLDPACGSGHILVEAYDLFKQIYLERGYRLRDIPRLILKNNLFGLDVDGRAAQMACFALIMTARADDRRILDHQPKTNIRAIKSSKDDDAGQIATTLFASISAELVPSFELFPETSSQPALMIEEGSPVTAQDIQELCSLFKEAETLGSLIIIPASLKKKLPSIKSLVAKSYENNDLLARHLALDLEPIVAQAEVLSREYDILAANPPYMSKGMNDTLRAFGQTEFPNSKSDLFSMFVERSLCLVKSGGNAGFMTPFVWMFLRSYEKLRGAIFQKHSITSLIRPEYHSFFESAFVPICTFCIAKEEKNLIGTYIDLSDFYGEALQAVKTRVAINDKTCAWRYEVSSNDFLAIPGSPVAYQLGPDLNNLFKRFSTLKNYADVKEGLNTGNNARFLRLWQEVSFGDTHLYSRSRVDAEFSGKRWFPCNKGGSFRRWYGNNEYVINWEYDGNEIRNYKDEKGIVLSAPRNLDYLFREGLTWSGVGSSGFSMRYFEEGFVFNSAGRSLFPHTNPLYLLGFLNSHIASKLLEILAPTLSFTVGDVASLPLKSADKQERLTEIESCVNELVRIAKQDWDSQEQSWDFQRLPLVENLGGELSVQNSVSRVIRECGQRVLLMQALETQNNEYFLESHGLGDALPSYVSERSVALDKAEQNQWLLRLISYALGCMMGRYSLDAPSLTYANSGNEGFDPGRYTTFPAASDGILPLTDTDWFGAEDTANRFGDFLKAAWPAETYHENVQFVADSLSPKAGEAPMDTIRRYLATGFYKDHLQTYKKRPIYWLFSSGKERAFQALVYLHRYNEGTLARMRIEYVAPLQSRISARIDQLDKDIAISTSTGDRKKRESEKAKLTRQYQELFAFDEKLRHFADQRIHLDLDDGVKVNYGKFGDLLADVKAITGDKDE